VGERGNQQNDQSEEKSDQMPDASKGFVEDVAQFVH
jgi:hypothetical protein